MGKRRPTVPGGRKESGDGYDHRDHGHSSVPPWEGMHTADRARARRRQHQGLRRLRWVFGDIMSGTNRKYVPQRNP